MTEIIQKFLLAHSKKLQFIVNEKLAKKSGPIGRFFRFFAIGKRQYGEHYVGRLLLSINTFFLFVFRAFSNYRVLYTRLYSQKTNVGSLLAIPSFYIFFCYILTPQTKISLKDIKFDKQDQPQNIAEKYGVAIPTNLLNERTSAHYIEIDAIYFAEMSKKLIEVTKEIIAERNLCSDEEKKMRYCTNPNYVYKPLPPMPADYKPTSMLPELVFKSPKVVTK